MFRLDVAVDVVPMLVGGNKYIANCGAADGRKRVEDFRLEGSTMRNLLICLIDKMEELNIPDDEIHIVSEFNPDDLSTEDYEAWSTTLKDIRKHDSGLNRYLKKLNN